jgi:BASS family bile acid:Na+ symporter
LEIVTTIAPIALALIMLGLGLGLSLDDFNRVLKHPKNFLVGSLCQLILLPIIAFILVIIYSPPLEIALGVMIIAAAPGGVTSNVLTKFANGDVALSISLTAIISLISIISVPFIIFQSANLLGAESGLNENISMIGIAMKMFLVVTIPVILGMLIRKFATNFIASKTKMIQKISVALFVLVFFSIIYEERDRFLSFLEKAGVITLTLNLVMMLISFYMAKLLIRGIAQRKCITLECGVQNGTLAVFVATQLVDDIAYLVPTAAYAVIMYITSIIFIFIVRNIK